MKDIVIKFIDKESEDSDMWKGWLVKQGDKYAAGLGFDEMLGVVAALTMPTERPALQWMKTKESHLRSRLINKQTSFLNSKNNNPI